MFLTYFDGAAQNFIIQFANILVNSQHRDLYAYSNWNLLLSFEVTKDKPCFELSLTGATLKADVTNKE